MEIDQARLLTLYAAHKMDEVGNKEARNEIAEIKVVAPNVTQRVLDRVIQAHGEWGSARHPPPPLVGGESDPAARGRPRSGAHGGDREARAGAQPVITNPGGDSAGSGGGERAAAGTGRTGEGPARSHMEIRAVIFDVGGVIQESPLLSSASSRRGATCRRASSPASSATTAARPDGAWQRLERGEILLDEFCRIFDSEIAERGYSVSTPPPMMLEMAEYAVIRPRMLEAVRRIRAGGIKAAALTNNWLMEEKDEERETLKGCFDAFIESCRTGIRKPDPRIYELTCEALGVLPGETAFLDDIGANLKTAAKLGMQCHQGRRPRRGAPRAGRSARDRSLRSATAGRRPRTRKSNGPMTKVTVVAPAFASPKAPSPSPTARCFSSRFARGTVSRVMPEGTVGVMARTGGGPNGIALGPDGRCYVCNNGGFEWRERGGQPVPGLQARTTAGGGSRRWTSTPVRVEVLYRESDRGPLRGPNDIVFDAHGGFWFSDLGRCGATTWTAASSTTPRRTEASAAK